MSKTSEDNARQSQGVQSVEIGARVLRAYLRAEAPMSVKELADEVDMSTSRTHRYLASLVRAGLIERDAASGRYDLGELTLQLGVAALNRLNPVAEASKIRFALRSGRR
ncbi:bacterial regulatory, arsR family protein [Paraburkholderia xenovorans LB400]|uniref:Transcriptional regulator, IclR family n=1 Tax=Paraburkholderia xenovorans (strain LB400) TaxID=266265 RepID=Q13VQ2_PARXL|nr:MULTISPECIES: helix-turn-helix domain-containing protein [Pseudomonadota]ABE31837.1 transcriptional regulator, IclR family [Paraburkholderia xenovorans LB400]AIP30233.1 bacterial regulatory, arsR family protein [Paraburkholderia xenovorans LB400]